jgi:hypothetical protein
VKAEKIEEFFVAKERLLSRYQEKLQERKSDPGKGRKLKVTPGNSKELSEEKRNV